MSPEMLGSRLKQARKARGLTQEQLAVLLHVTRQTVSNWENARSQPDYTTLERLADTLDTPLSSLLGLIAEETDVQMAEGEGEPDPHSPDQGALSEEDAPDGEAPVLPPDEPSPQADPAPVEIPPAQADAPEVVQPQARRHLRWIPVFAALLALILVLWGGRTPQSSAQEYPLQWYETAQTPVEGSAFLKIYTKEDPLPYRTAANESDRPYWQACFFIREEHRIGFQIERLLIITYFPDGTSTTEVYDKAHLSQEIGSSHVNAGRMTSFMATYYQEHDPPVGMGCVIEGVDDKGNQMTFGQYVPCQQP